jgi:hypothetical protein
MEHGEVSDAVLVHALASEREGLIVADRVGLGRHPSADRALRITHRDHISGADMWLANFADGKIC